MGTLKKAVRLIQSKAFVLAFILTIKILGLASGMLHPLEIALLPISGSACIGTLINDWRNKK